MLEFDIKNKEVSENDMSQSEKYGYDVQLYIISKGEPAAVYEIKEALKMNQPTVRNICQRSEKLGVLTKENGSRNKIMYCPTWDGVMGICFMNPKMLKEIDTMLDGWFKQPKFMESLKEDFGEVVTKNPDYAKALTKRMIEYELRIYEKMQNLTDEEHTHMEHIFAEQKLLMQNPGAWQTALEFYKHVKFFRDNINRLRQNTKETEKAWSIIDGMFMH